MMWSIRWIGRFLLGIAYGIFGSLHFLYTEADMGIVPSFVGSSRFWVYFIGVCWIATAVSFITNILTRISGLLASLLLILIMIFVLFSHFGGKDSYLQLAFMLGLMGGSVMVAADGTTRWPFRGGNTVK